MNVCIVGSLCRDKIIVADKVNTHIGGVPYYAGETLSSLGVKTTLFASFSDNLKPFLKNFKSTIKQIKCNKSVCFINEYPDINKPNKRIQKCENNSKMISLKDFLGVDFNNFDFIIFGSLFHNDISFDLIKKASDSEANIILAAQGLIRYLENDQIVWKNPEKVINLLPFVNYLFLDREELEFISGGKDMSYLKNKGGNNIVVTNGINGSKLYFDDKVFKIPAFRPRKLVDPTGAGDSYMAGFIKAQELYDDFIKQGRFAAMVATMNIEKKGAFDSSEKRVIEKLLRARSA